jgi:hypothetical protein
VAALARPVAREHGIAGGGVEFNILCQWFAGRARGAAKDTGGTHGNKKNAIVGRVALVESGLHFINWGESFNGLHVIILLDAATNFHRKMDLEFRE